MKVDCCLNSKVCLTIEYDGTAYFGWQFQGDDKPSVQQKLEEALAILFNEKVGLVGASRTDKGVHARNQVAHFRAPREVDTYNFIRAFPAYLPPDIVVKKAELVPDDFHAIKSAVAKTYVYRIWNNDIPSALLLNRALWIRKPLDIERLNRACRHLIGTQDFNCFRSEGTETQTTVRTINSAKFIKSEGFIEFHINGSGFLKQMIRNIVGTLLQIEMNGRDEDSIPALIASRDRTQAGPTVEPQGLYLEKVHYT